MQFQRLFLLTVLCFYLNKFYLLIFFKNLDIINFLLLSFKDFLETKMHAEDLRIKPSFSILSLFAFKVAPVVVMSVIISD